MTPLQKRIFDYIRAYVDEHIYSPSLVEIAQGIGISPNSISLISRHVHALVGAGLLKFHKKGYRSVQVVENSGTLSLPLMGYLGEGKLCFADQQSIDLHRLLKHEGHFMLAVKGDALIGENMLDGDWVLCKRVEQACEGDRVLAVVNEMLTAGRISYEIKDRITLIPTCPKTKPKAYLPHRVQIHGVMVGILRFMVYSST